MACCGQDYVSVAETRCCSASSGASQPHVRKSSRVPVRCCETALIPGSQACCNGVGYDPLEYVCSDKTPTGTRATVTDRTPLGGAGWRAEREINTLSMAIVLEWECGNCHVHYSFPHPSILIPNELTVIDVIAANSKGINTAELAVL